MKFIKNLLNLNMILNKKLNYIVYVNIKINNVNIVKEFVFKNKIMKVNVVVIQIIFVGHYVIINNVNN